MSESTSWQHKAGTGGGEARRGGCRGAWSTGLEQEGVAGRGEGGVPYPGWPMGITLHLGEDQVSGFEISAHVFSPTRRLLPPGELGRGEGSTPPAPATEALPAARGPAARIKTLERGSGDKGNTEEDINSALRKGGRPLDQQQGDAKPAPRPHTESLGEPNDRARSPHPQRAGGTDATHTPRGRSGPHAAWGTCPPPASPSSTTRGSAEPAAAEAAPSPENTAPTTRTRSPAPGIRRGSEAPPARLPAHRLSGLALRYPPPWLSIPLRLQHQPPPREIRPRSRLPPGGAVPTATPLPAGRGGTGMQGVP